MSKSKIIPAAAVILSLCLVIFLIFSLTNKTCSEPGCTEKVYKDSYCRYHYTVHEAGAFLDNAARDIFGGLFG